MRSYLSVLTLVAGLASAANAAELPWPHARIIDLGANGFDFDYDSSRQLVYVSVPENNEIVYVSLPTAQIVDRHFVGSRPMGLDYATNADKVFVALNQAASVAEVDPNDRTVSEIVVGGSNGTGHSSIFDVVEGRPGQVFASANPGSGGFSYIAKIDLDNASQVTRVASNLIIRAEPVFQETQAGDVLYVSEGFSPNSLYKLDLTQSDAPVVFEDDHGSVSGTRFMDINPSGERIFLSSGQVLRSDSFLEAGGIGSGIPRLNEAGDIAYVYQSDWFSGADSFKSFSTSTFLELDEFDLPAGFPSGVDDFGFPIGVGQFEILPNGAGLVMLSGQQLLIAIVPEPGTIALSCVASLGILLTRRSRAC